MTQSAGDDIRAGMGVGLIFPAVLLLALFLFGRRARREPQKLE